MEVINCKTCGKLFNYMGGAPLCPKCVKDVEDKFAQVKQYVYDNPGANINMVAEENDVTVKQIKRWIREERLSFSDDSAVGIECENCGKMIKTGRFCNACKKTLENTLSNVYKKPKTVQQKKQVNTEARMRFLDK